MGPKVDPRVGHWADRMEDRRVGPKVDRRVGPKVDRRAGHLADRMEDQRVGPKVDRWEARMEDPMVDRKEGPKVDRWVDRMEGRRAGQTVARTVGLVALQVAWVEALVLGLWEPPVAPRPRIPRSAA